LADNARYYYHAASAGLTERLSLRHDARYNPEDIYSTTVTPQQRSGKFGNVLYADFHVGLFDAAHENNGVYFVAYQNQPNIYR